MKKIKYIVLILTVIIIFAGIYAAVDINKDMKKNHLKETVTINIADGATGNSVIKSLKENGVIKYPTFFKMKAKSDGSITKFQPGDLTVEPNTSYEEIINSLKTTNRNMFKVTIPEGYEMRQIAEKFAETGVVSTDDFYAAAKASDYDYKFLKDIPKRENELEGYLYPDTYVFPHNTSAHDIIKMMLDEFDNCFKEEYYQQAENMNMTVDQIVTLASIIERETNVPEERAKVAGVFYNRINSNMKLQSCATVQYILKDRKAKLSNADVQIDSKYNTYKYSGLPIGPIASAGEECIKAALYPEKTTAKYFVLGKDGKHVFSDTYQQHLAAKEKAES